jgi:hypothetical protein
MDLVADIAARTKCFAGTNILSGLEVRAVLLNHLVVQYPNAAKAA